MKASNKDLDALKLNWAKMLETFETTEAELDVDSYIHHFWLSSSTEYVTANKLFASFKKATIAQNARATLDSLVNDATLYRQIGEPRYGKWKKEDDSIQVSLTALTSVFRMRPAVPSAAVADAVLPRQAAEQKERGADAVDD
jgi:hypothetical protein